MAIITNAREMTMDQLRAHVRTLSEPDLLAQELVQKGALHSLQQLVTIGVTEANAHELIAQLRRMASIISAEAKRRGIPTVDLPGSH